MICIISGKTKAGVKYKGTVEVPNLSDENDMEDLDVSVGLQTQIYKRGAPGEENAVVMPVVWSPPDIHITEQGRAGDVAARTDEDERSW